MDHSDAPTIIEVRFVPSKLWRIACLTAIPAIACLVLAFGVHAPSPLAVAGIEVAAASLAAMSAYFVYLAIARSGRTAFTVGPAGILDKRISNDIIGWNSVEAVSTRRASSIEERGHNDDRVVLLKLKQAEASRLRTTKIGKLGPALDSGKYGADAFQIRTGGTDVDYRRLLTLCQSYIELAKSNRDPC